MLFAPLALQGFIYNIKFQQQFHHPFHIQTPGIVGVVILDTRNVLLPFHKVAVIIQVPDIGRNAVIFTHNQSGQLGDGTTTDRYTPVQVSGLSGVTAIAAGWWHTVVVKSDGTVWAWGANGGRLGDGTTNNRTTPVQVSGLSGVTAIAAGANHTVALKGVGTVWAWGYNDEGQLGNNSTNTSLTPVQVSGQFLPNTYTVSASVTGSNGTITPTSASITYGSSATFTIIPNTGYYLTSLTDNGTNVINYMNWNTNTYTINNVTAAHNVVATFAQGAAPAPTELNIYGSSAQYLYWYSMFQNFAQNQLGCTGTTTSMSGAHAIFHATGCTSTLVPAKFGRRDLDIRYSGITSGDGILALSKQAPLDPALATGCNVANGERRMYASATTTVCKKVHVGTSDVAGNSLIQYTIGQKLGPMGGGQFIVGLTGIDTAGLTPANTMVVPFGFFVNQAVKAKTCTSGLTGSYCTANSHCETVYGKSDGVCGAPATITNISRVEVALIFSGAVADWSDLGAYFTAQPVVACLHHAGSGTHSAFDLTVMNSGWGANSATEEVQGQTWFNQGSSDMIKCINGNTTATPTGSLVGAIGYADADQPVGVANTSQNVAPLKYNGFYPTRAVIRNGLYDFFTNAWLYTNPINTTTVNALAAELVAYTKDPANVPSSKINYWATQGEMKYNRSVDISYPEFVGASNPMLP